MFNGRRQPHPYFFIAKWLFFTSSTSMIVLPDPKGPLLASLSTETIKTTVLDTCTCTCVFEIINFETLF